MTDNPIQRYVTREQMERMRDAAHSLNESKPLGRALRDEVIVAFLFDTGLRNDETRFIQPDGMIRLDGSELYLPGSIQKDYPHESSPGSVTLSLDKSEIGLVRLLRNYLNSDWYQSRGTDYLFPTRQSDKISEDGLRKVVQRLAVEADVRPYMSNGERADPGDLKTHDLRHSVANWMLSETDENWNPQHRLVDVKNRLRHSSIVTTDTTYNHFKRR